MNLADVVAYIKEEYQVDPDYPFSKEYAQTPVFRHQDTKKWFALCMKVRADKLGYPLDAEWIDVITLKSEPALIDGIILRQGFHRAYHMNKTKWLTIELNDKVDSDEVMSLIDMSFELTGKKSK